MRMIGNLTGTLLIAGMAAYAWTPRAAAQPMSSHATAVAAQQQDQTARPKQKETKPSKQTKSEKPPKAENKQTTRSQPENAEHKQTTPNRPENAEHKQTTPNQPERANRHQQKEEKTPPQQAQKGRNQPAGAHGRISDNDYRSHFGHSHSFTVRRVVTTTRIVPNQTQFVYGGYTFIFLAPWPSEWALTDDCYIDYVDGEYVLIDPAHPGMTIALEIGG